MDMTTAWKQLKHDFSTVEEASLKSVISSIQHFEQGDTKELRQDATPVQEWLHQHQVKPGSLHQWVSERSKSQYSVQYSEKRNHARQRDLTQLKAALLSALPEKNPQDLRRIVRRLSRHHYGEVKSLRDEDLIVNDILLRHNLSASRAYRWLVELVLPEDLKEQLSQGTVGMCQASRLLSNRERQRKIAMELQLLDDARRIVQEVLG